MPEAAVAPPVAPTSPAAAPAAPSIGTVPIGLSNIPTTPAFKKAAAALRSDKYSANPDPPGKQQDKPGETKPEAAKTETPQTAPTDKTEPDPAKTDTDQVTQPKTDEKTKDGKTKISPWKLVDEWKGKHALAEKQISELQTKLAEASSKAPDAAETKKLTERLEAAEARAQKAEEELKFADYSKSDDFKRDYEKPYEDSWNAGRAVVSRLTVTQADGTTRKGTNADWDRLMEIHFQDPAAAAAEMSELFGPQASVVSSYIVDTEKQGRRATSAIEEYRTSGSKRQEARAEAAKRHVAQLNEQLSKDWESANKAALEDPRHGEYFKQRDGDPDWNQRLAKGFELVDRAYKESARDPNLTPEQRKAVINRHAAVRHRAAAFGAIRYDNQRLRAENAELKSMLDQYAESEPTDGDGKGKDGTAAAQGGSAMDRAKANLRNAKYLR